MTTDLYALTYWQASIFIFAALLARYGLLSGLAYWFFWARDEKYSHLRVQKDGVTPRPRHEVLWSISTNLVFALGTASVYRAAAAGLTRVYLDPAEYGWTYFGFSVLLLIVLHDAYFYFAHRLMHSGWIYRRVHSIHHRSLNPTPLATFAFHPVEAVVESLFIFSIVFVLPLHPLAILALLSVSNLMNLNGHMGLEFFAGRNRLGALFPWLNSATNHSRHHRYASGNYGLYFTFWDRLLRTELRR